MVFRTWSYVTVFHLSHWVLSIWTLGTIVPSDFTDVCRTASSPGHKATCAAFQKLRDGVVQFHVGHQVPCVILIVALLVITLRAFQRCIKKEKKSRNNSMYFFGEAQKTAFLIMYRDLHHKLYVLNLEYARIQKLASYCILREELGHMYNDVSDEWAFCERHFQKRKENTPAFCYDAKRGYFHAELPDCNDEDHQQMVFAEGCAIYSGDAEVVDEYGKRVRELRRRIREQKRIDEVGRIARRNIFWSARMIDWGVSPRVINLLFPVPIGSQNMKKLLEVESVFVERSVCGSFKETTHPDKSETITIQPSNNLHESSLGIHLPFDNSEAIDVVTDDEVDQRVVVADVIRTEDTVNRGHITTTDEDSVVDQEVQCENSNFREIESAPVENCVPDSSDRLANVQETLQSIYPEDSASIHSFDCIRQESDQETSDVELINVHSDDSSSNDFIQV